MSTKYHSRKVVWNGIQFDSAKEARRYQELLLLKRAGVILDLERQVKFELIPAQYEEIQRGAGCLSQGRNGQDLRQGWIPRRMGR